jgi:hypothetical protein
MPKILSALLILIGLNIAFFAFMFFHKQGTLTGRDGYKKRKKEHYTK